MTENAPRMAPPSPPMRPMPPSHLAMAIMAVFVFWPVGLAAIINAARVDRFVFTGDLAAAHEASTKAATFSKIAFGVAIGLFVLYMVVYAIIIAAFISHAGASRFAR
jgi:Interferon-induced transmembrane protein